MTNLQRLKADRDICYNMACAAYGQEFVNELLFEGDDINDIQTRESIEQTRATLTPIYGCKVSGQLDTAKDGDVKHHDAGIRIEEWYAQ